MARRRRHRAFWKRTRWSKRERLGITACIAAASVAAAVGAWRSEFHANRGDEIDRAGFAQQVAFERENISVRSGGVGFVARYVQQQTAAAEAAALRGEAQRASAADARSLRAEAASFAAEAATIRAAMDPDAFTRGTVTSSSLDAALRKELLLRFSEADLYPLDEFRAADRRLRIAERDAGFSALAIAAALLLTLAQVLRRRAFLAGGVLTLATSVALLVVFEFQS